MSRRHKYPRTPHLPFTRAMAADDKILLSTDHLKGQEVVVSLKKDGECTSLYKHSYHAKSLDSRHHPSRDWLKAFHATFAHDIPEGWRICGENLYAQHSIAYDDLPSYFMGFSVWDEKNWTLSWDDTEEFFELLSIESVPVVYRGPYEDAIIQALADKLDTEKEEGLVVRLARAFRYEDFAESVAKWVRKGHVQTDEHWMHGPVIPNKLRRGNG